MHRKLLSFASGSKISTVISGCRAVGCKLNVFSTAGSVPAAAADTSGLRSTLPAARPLLTRVGGDNCGLGHIFLVDAQAEDGQRR